MEHQCFVRLPLQRLGQASYRGRIDTTDGDALDKGHSRWLFTGLVRGPMPFGRVGTDNTPDRRQYRPEEKNDTDFGKEFVRGYCRHAAHH